MKGNFSYEGTNIKYKFTIREYLDSDRMGYAKIDYGRFVKLNVINTDVRDWYSSLLKHYNKMTKEELTKWIESEIINDIESEKV